MRKMRLWFFLGSTAGFMVALATLFPLLHVLNTSASESETQDDSLVTLVPDIKGIYEDALLTPFEQVGAEITDPEIKGFFEKLIQNAGLTREDGSD